jgi:hypothetical protein
MMPSTFDMFYFPVCSTLITMSSSDDTVHKNVSLLNRHAYILLNFGPRLYIRIWMCGEFC